MISMTAEYAYLLLVQALGHATAVLGWAELLEWPDGADPAYTFKNRLQSAIDDLEAAMKHIDDVEKNFVKWGIKKT
jgi:hypothetical protein